MTEKRYRSEHIVGATSPFIVDNYSAKEYNKFVSYKTYETTTMEKCDELTDLLNNYEDEIEHLKKELTKFKEWEKHIGDVKREDIDKIFNLSVYEIAEGFEYYKKRIKELENMIK